MAKGSMNKKNSLDFDFKYEYNLWKHVTFSSKDIPENRKLSRISWFRLTGVEKAIEKDVFCKQRNFF